MKYFNVENNKITYDCIAQNYTNIAIREIAPKAFVDSFLNSLVGKNIIDVCCGTGQIAKYMAKQGFNVFGIDISEKMLKIARQIAPNCKFQQANALDFSSDNKFDGAFVHDCLFNFTLEQAKALIKNIYKLLTNNGTVFLSFLEGNYENFENIVPNTPLRIFVRKFSVKEINEILDGYFKITGMWAINEMEQERNVGRKFYLLLNRVVPQNEEDKS